MRTQGTAGFSAMSVEQGMRTARLHYGPGRRVTFLRSKPDVPSMAPGIIVSVRWETYDQEAVDRAWREQNEPLTGLQRQAMAYLAEETY